MMLNLDSLSNLASFYFAKTLGSKWSLTATDILSPGDSEDPNHGLAVVNVAAHSAHAIDMTTYWKRRKV